MTTAAAVRPAGTSSGTEPMQETVPSLKQRVAFVSGGMGGIGTAVCRRLARGGVQVVAGCLPRHEKKDDWIAGMRDEGLLVHADEGNVEEHNPCCQMLYHLSSQRGPEGI